MGPRGATTVSTSFARAVARTQGVSLREGTRAFCHSDPAGCCRVPRLEPASGRGHSGQGHGQLKQGRCDWSSGFRGGQGVGCSPDAPVVPVRNPGTAVLSVLSLA